MNTSQAPTLQDVADRAGVSRSTASFAFTGRGRIAAGTRERVLRAAGELGYRANPAAQNLRRGWTGAVALKLPVNTEAMAYYMEVTFGVVEEAHGAGVSVTLLPPDSSPESLRHLQADGVIIIDPSPDDDAAVGLLNGGIPAVCGEAPLPGMPEPAGVVVVDHRSAVVELLDHFSKEGARRPALICPDIRNNWTESVRNAFALWCRSHGIEPVLLMTSMSDVAESTRRAAQNLLVHDDEIDSVIVMSDGTALGVANEARAQGRVIGGDLLVAAAVDSLLLASAGTPVTAIDHAPRELGRRCMRLMRAVVENRSESPVTDRHAVSLHVRASSSRSS
ncbi:LacI family DNA-binding transcriptional regulator [Zhihengliuella halotolerans]|uniref:LacI family DNA-binding transcriptional regulator n=1 Tax=Zhihengliuella halotolerans TaxID=370736 RepID=UPI000C80191D|nr:LacI family DNA-binding transcriptional regulator [Zhihengliuella halotolerans]